MANAPMGVTETGATAQSIVANLLQRELAVKSVLLPTILDYSSLVMPGAKEVAIPKATSFTAQNKSENTSTEWQAITASVDTVLLNIYKHIPARLEDIARAQSVIDWDVHMLGRMTSSMVTAIEASIASVLVKATNAIQLSGTSNLAATKADILEAKRILTAANVPLEDRFLAVPPGQEKALLAISDFVSASDYGSSMPIQNGELGRIYGFRVIVSNSFASDTEFVAYHKEHACFASQIAPKFEKQRAPLNELADDYSLSLLYGVKQLNGGAMGVYADESAV